jgi:hypothetical protein
MQDRRISTKGKGPGEGKTNSKTENKPELVPPDGGWGWVIVFAFALSNVSLSLQLSHDAYQLQMLWIITLIKMFMNDKYTVAFESWMMQILTCLLLK